MQRLRDVASADKTPPGIRLEPLVITVQEKPCANDLEQVDVMLSTACGNPANAKILKNRRPRGKI
jgi:hypothetical protein